ncbi:MAG: capsular polysaccharide synthesis protein [Treponema sp.]|nr:capsular polysaccharide synthesis protein [Treponema sp.]
MNKIKILYSKIIARLNVFLPQLKEFGIQVPFWTFLFTYDDKWRPVKTFFGLKKHKSIMKYLMKHYIDDINDLLRENTCKDIPIDPESTLWVFWWDGCDSMPDIVKMCFKSIVQHAGRHPVKLITNKNIHDFISIPEYIMEKVNSGIITVTHFSDIIRSALLYEYGGIWLDATVFVTQDICFDNLVFFTLKNIQNNNSISNIRWQGITNDYFRINNCSNASINRWSGFLLAGSKHSPLFAFMRNIFFSYWKEHNLIIDYLFIDYVIALSCDILPSIKEMIDSVPCSEGNKFDLENNLNNTYSIENFNKYSKNNFHKLSWKKKFNMFSEDNKLTLYGFLINNMS